MSTSENTKYGTRYSTSTKNGHFDPLKPNNNHLNHEKLVKTLDFWGLMC